MASEAPQAPEQPQATTTHSSPPQPATSSQRPPAVSPSQTPPKNSQPPLAEREAQLAKVAFFDGLTAEALAMIAQVTTEEDHPGGTRLFSYGEPGDKLYIILEGKVRISREVGGMGEEALAVLGAGDVFGEMSLLDESPRSADAHAHERCRLLVITKDAFDDLLFLHKDLAYEVLWSCVRMLAARLRETNDKLTFLSTSGRF